MKRILFLWIFLIFTSSLAQQIEGKWEDLDEQALQYIEKEDYKNAIIYGKKALDEAVGILGEEDEMVAYLLHNLAAYYSYTGELKNSLELDQKGLAIREKNLTPTDLRLADSLIRTGTSAASMNQYNLAESSFKRAVKIYDTHKDISAYDRHELWLRIGKFYRDIGRYEDGEKAYKRSLSYAEKLKDTERVNMASVLNSLGTLYIYWDKTDQTTLDIFKKALQINLQYHGKMHSETGTSYNNIGAYFYTIKKYKLAKENFEQALFIREKILGPNNADVAQTLNNLGELNRMLEDYPNAISYLNRAIEVDSAVYGPDNTEVAMDLFNLSLTYYDMAEYQKAREYATRVLEIREDKLPPEHPDIKEVKNLLESIQEEMTQSI